MNKMRLNINLNDYRYCLDIFLIKIMNFQQIGYRSMMKGSQSISDLTNAMDAPNNSRISEHSGTVSAQGKIYEPYLFLY